MSKMRLLSGLCALALAGCAVGPDYVRPEIDTAAQFKETKDWKLASPSDEIPRGEWWTIFGDEDLNRLEQQLNQHNQSIAAAEAQYREATASLQEAQAGFYPTVSAGASETRGRSTGSASSSSVVAKSYDASLSASWELDLWGKVRRQVEAGRAGSEASQASLANIRLSEQAALAIAYFQLYVSDRLARSLQASIEAYQRELQITRNSYAAGVSGEADVLQAENQLETLQVQATDQGLQRAELEHSIAVLTGQAPSDFALSERTLAPHVPEIPAGLPSELLERRPDIAQAERLVAQANAEIGVAKAAYYPNLTLGASGGYLANNLAHWISVPSRIWSIGPSLAETLFDGGLRNAQTSAAQATYDQSVASYRQTVLAAFQNVEDNLAAERILQQEAQTEHLAVESARKSAAITFNQYQAGTASMLNVSQSNATLQANLRTEFNILNSRLTAAVGLIKALGGGYVQAKAS